MDTQIPPMQKPDDSANLTIVGGRPSQDRSLWQAIPRGLEVLLKKASVDNEFQGLLLKKRSWACEAIGLSLDPAEAAMLDVVPTEQLIAIIRGTRVPAEDRRIFLGQAASVMLAALGVGTSGCSAGIRPDKVPGPGVSSRIPYPHSHQARASGRIRCPRYPGVFSRTAWKRRSARA
jgi:hypothetical protein